jgi:hypothetical protein
MRIAEAVGCFRSFSPEAVEHKHNNKKPVKGQGGV